MTSEVLIRAILTKSVKGNKRLTSIQALRRGFHEGLALQHSHRRWDCVTLSRAYGSFGNPLTTTGTTSYGFGGEWTDFSDLQYLRAL